MPAIEPSDTIRLAEQDLIKAIQNKHQTAPISLTTKHTEALRQLAGIFAEAAGTASENSYELPRVQVGNKVQQSNKPSTSHNATAPRVLNKQHQVHERATHSNTPMHTIVEEPSVHMHPQQNNPSTPNTSQ
jgi:plastocyanin